MVQFCYLKQYLGIETVSCRQLQRMARMDIDSNLKKYGQLFQVLMQYLQISPKKIIMVIAP